MAPASTSIAPACCCSRNVSRAFPASRWKFIPTAGRRDSEVLKGAAAVVIYSDGGVGHPALQDDHLQQLGALMKQGVGLACIHYAVEPTIEKGQREFLDWIGGCFEINRSVNPVWTADFKTLPDHPITRGVKPFKLKDEWYFNMRFRDGMKGVTPILTAVPTPDTMSRPDGPHEGNPGVRAAVQRGEPQVVAWASERPDGGRGFGFTGGHYHHNWGNDNMRKVVLNGILLGGKSRSAAGRREFNRHRRRTHAESRSKITAAESGSGGNSVW